MSKKSSCIWSRNLLQSHLKNKPTTKPTCQSFISQKPLEKQQSEQNIENNYRRKLHKTTNNSKRYATSKDKFRGHNCMPNNRTRPTPTTRKNVTRTLHFNENSLWRRDSIEKANQAQLTTEWKSSKHCQNKHNESHNLYNNCKLTNLPNPQRQQCGQIQLNQSLQHCYHDFGKNNAHKSFNTAYETHSLPVPCLSYVHVIPPKLDNNHCQRAHLHNGESKSKMFKLHDVIASVSSSSIQLSKCHNRYDSQLTWLPQVSQHQELLLGMFEVLPPLFLLNSPTCRIIESGTHIKYRNHCLLESMKHQCHPYENEKSKMLHQLSPRRTEHINLNNDGVLKYLKTKPKLSDRDVIFGNAYQILSKHYGWETSRIEWLHKLEQEYQNDTKNKLNYNKC